MQTIEYFKVFAGMRNPAGQRAVRQRSFSGTWVAISSKQERRAQALGFFVF